LCSDKSSLMLKAQINKKINKFKYVINILTLLLNRT